MIKLNCGKPHIKTSKLSQPIMKALVVIPPKPLPQTRWQRLFAWLRQRLQKFQFNRFMALHLVWEKIRNAFALLGLLTTLLLIFFYYQGLQAITPFSPKFLDLSAEFAHKTLQDDVATALVVKMPIHESVSVDQAIKAMKGRAKALNLRYLNSYALHQAIEKKTGQNFPHMQIFEFCNPLLAKDVLLHNRDYLIHMPCRIALYQDDLGKFWLSTVNLGLLIHGAKHMPKALHLKALSAQDSLLDIMAAGASGKF